jgi:hypothetical protein
MNKFKKSDIIEEIIHTCSYCGEEDPCCYYCENEVGCHDLFYCNVSTHICETCYKAGRHRRKI